ncbi:MAG TPA: ROK family protein [Streptosporangiaceae bacterium]|nr:ROK family protein [Streptosporangiaceae bacterium]
MTSRQPVSDPLPGTSVTVGVDLGGTGTRLVALAYSGTVRSALSTSTRHDAPAGSNQLIVDLAALIHEVAAGAALAAVGIGASGPVDSRGIIRNDDTLPAYSHIPLAELVTARLAVPCVIDNDAVAAATGENACGAGEQSSALLAITLGTGVGVALLIGNAAYRGSDGTHPEAGHIPVPGPPAPCYCGLATCWEQLASRTALDALTGNATAEVAAKAAAGDQLCRRIFDRYGEHVGVGLSTLTAIFRPARVVICGSPARYLPLITPGINRALTRARPFTWSPPIVGAALAEYSGAIGAAVMARTLENNPQPSMSTRGTGHGYG